MLHARGRCVHEACSVQELARVIQVMPFHSGCPAGYAARSPHPSPWWFEAPSAQYGWVSQADDLAHARSGLVLLAPTSLLEISATNIRYFCISSRKSARYLLPDATLDYVQINQLYLESQ